MTEHFVISLKSLQQSQQFYHETEFDGETFRAICGADKRMDIPVLIRKDNIGDHWTCGNCMRIQNLEEE